MLEATSLITAALINDYKCIFLTGYKIKDNYAIIPTEDQQSDAEAGKIRESERPSELPRSLPMPSTSSLRAAASTDNGGR